MAGRQLGKLRQWAGEVISSRDKTTVTDEFRELERDIELRRDGAQRLLLASEAYHHSLSKKKKLAGMDGSEELLPVDAMGLVMIVHGEEFGDDSEFGTSLVQFGRAHCKIATLQESYALTFKDSFVSSLESYLDEIKELDAQKKKMESRRLSYDASISKFEKLKGSKKEKERREAEDEMERAKERYEETVDELSALMQGIQEHETVQLRELSTFLDLELKFVEQYLDILKEVKEEWHEGSNVRKAPPQSVPGRERSMQAARPQRRLDPSSSDSSDDLNTRSVSSRRSSIKHNKTNSTPTSKVSSQPPRSASRGSRNRSDSVGSATGDEKERDSTKDKPRRLSVAEWASSAVESVTGRGRKNKDKFESLEGTENKQRESDEKDKPTIKKSNSFSISRKLVRDKSKESLQSSPKPAARILKPLSLQEKKVVRALYDFTGAVDELSFSAGDEITVINEVIDGWWMGELSGKKGLFPTSHVEILPTKPALPLRPRALSASKADRAARFDKASISSGEEGYASSETDDHELRSEPLVHPVRSPFYGVFAEATHTRSSLGEDEEEKSLVPAFNRADDRSGASSDHQHQHQYEPREAVPISLSRHSSGTATDGVSNASSSLKRAPPPPPPRRPTNPASSTPPVPERPYQTSRAKSGSLKTFGPTPASSKSSLGYDTSPFESATELSSPRAPGACSNFKQSPFHPKGMCSNCFQLHG